MLLTGFQAHTFVARTLKALPTNTLTAKEGQSAYPPPSKFLKFTHHLLQSKSLQASSAPCMPLVATAGPSLRKPSPP